MANKPVNRKKQRRNYIIAEIFIYLLVIFIACHVTKSTKEGIYALLDGLEHLTQHPLDILPIDFAAIRPAFLLGLLPALLLYTDYLRRRDLRPSVEKGSAQWNEDIKEYNQHYAEMTLKVPKPIRKLVDFLCQIPVLGWLFKKIWKGLSKSFGVLDRSPQSKNMIFSNDIYMSMDTRKTRRNNNVLVIGGSGTGKSRFVVKPNMLQANCSYVITDPSGELLETMGGYLKNMGYEIRVFNLVQMDHSNTYNPFNYVRNEEGILTMINALIKNTTPKGSSPSDPFWEKAETALLQACCFYLQSECNPEDRNFSSVMKLLRCASAIEGQENVDSTLDIMFNDLKAKDPEHIGVLSYAVFKSAGGGKTAQSILISCQTRLQTFNLTAIKNLTNTDNIDLGSIGDKKVALFCTTPVVDSTFNYLVALMYTQLFETLYYHAETQCKGMRLPVHVRFLLDEFANIGTIPEFDKKLATMRKYEISCTIIIQALSQLKAMYKDEWEVIVGNCDSLLFLGGSDETTLKYISGKLGKQTIRSINTSRSHGKQGSYSLSYNKDGRELMTQDELSNMDNINCILFIRGLYPFFSTKFALESHPNYKLTGDAKDEFKFDVKKKIQTGVNYVEQTEPDRTVRLFDEAQMADTMTAQREHRLHSRPPQRVSAKGRPCLECEDLSETIPHLDVPVSQLTPEQKAEQEAVLNEYEVEEIHVPDDEARLEEYAENLEALQFDMFSEYGGVEQNEEQK